jgi:oxygen-independent coproporphyrinogen-3 oxidase
MVFTLRVPKQPDGDKAPDSGLLPKAALSSLNKQPFGLYLHVPFCTKRCGYCDFNTYTATELSGFSAAQWPDALLQELQLADQVLGGLPTINTIFIGGGTPSLLDPDVYQKVFAQIQEKFDSNIEITIEANPDSVSAESLAGYLAVGINRVSFGMQSAASNVLKVLDRTHNPDSIPTAVHAAHEIGFENISLDLIYGTPGESDTDWLNSLKMATSLPINHLSAYSLIVESGTKLAKQVERGEIANPDDDIAATRYLMADEFLSEQGFQWYEISNWSRAGGECRHNQIYWQSANWWGAGPGAHSHIGSVRWWNEKYPATWASRLGMQNSPAAGREVLTLQQQVDEKVMLSLRQRAGLAVSELPNPAQINNLMSTGWFNEQALDQGRIVLSKSGRLMADRVAAELLK